MNRNRLSIISTIIIILEALVVGVLTLYRTRVILEYFGTNINSVIQLATQLTAYMLLFESGMTAAYQYNLYRPLLQNDKVAVTKLYNGMKAGFKIISLKMALCICCIAFLYSLVLMNKGVTYLEACSLLIIMGLRIAAPYFFTVPLRTLLIVIEKKYLTDIIETIKNIATILMEVCLILFTNIPLFLILSINIILCFLTYFVYVYFVKKYCILEENISEIDSTPNKMTRDVLVHRISGMVNSNTDGVLLSIFESGALNSVTIFTSFSSLISYPVSLVTKIVDGMRASIAIKTTENPDNAYTYFRQVFSFAKLTTLIVIPVFIGLANDFVNLWIGSSYQTSLLNVVLLSMTAVHQILIQPIYATRDSLGLYKESKKYSLLQAIANLIISLLLIVPFGITGILLGTVISDFFILDAGNIRLIFQRVFKRKLDMLWDFLGLFVIAAFSSCISVLVDGLMLGETESWFSLVIRATVITVIVLAVTFSYLWLTDQYFRMFIKRFLIKKKVSKTK